MLSTVSIVSQPAAEPVSLDLVRAHCRIDSQSEDELLAGYLRSARMMAERYLSRALITQTIQWTVTPENRRRPWYHYLHETLELPRAPVQSISTVTVLDDLGNSTAVSAATLPVVPPAVLLGWKADTAHDPARLTIGRETVLVDGRVLRHVNVDHIQVQFVAGYGVDGSFVPQPILDAIKLLTGFLYENRGDVPAEMPRAAEWLLDPYRLMFI